MDTLQLNRFFLKKPYQVFLVGGKKKKVFPQKTAFDNAAGFSAATLE